MQYLTLRESLNGKLAALYYTENTQRILKKNQNQVLRKMAQVLKSTIFRELDSYCYDMLICLRRGASVNRYLLYSTRVESEVKAGDGSVMIRERIEAVRAKW